MAVDTIKPNGPFTKLRAEEEREFRLIFMLIFPIFLVIAALSRLLSWITPTASGTGRSVVEEARAATNTCIPFAFMR